MRSARELSPHLLRRLIDAAAKWDLVILATDDVETSGRSAAHAGHHVVAATEGILVLAADRPNDPKHLLRGIDREPEEVWVWRRSAQVLDRLDPDGTLLLGRSGVGPFPVSPFVPQPVLDALEAKPDAPVASGTPRFLAVAAHVGRHRRTILDRYLSQ